MNCNTLENWDKVIEMLLYQHKNLKRKALNANISWTWGRHELENSLSKGENLKIEKASHKLKPKHRIRYTLSIYLNSTNMLFIQNCPRLYGTKSFLRLES